MESIQWQNLKDQYPVTQKGTYLKSASISGAHNQVLKKMHEWQTSMAVEAGINELRFFNLLQETKEVLSRFIGANPDEVALTENSSHNMNLIAMMLKKEKESGKNEIIMCEDEFPSCVLPFYHHGFNIKFVPTDNGHFSPEDLITQVSEKTAAVVASSVQFLTGLRLDLKKLSQLCEEKDVHLILNTTQSLGAFPLNLKELKVSALTSSCHKWLGAGIGQAILYLSEEFKKGRTFPLAGWCSVDEPFEMRNEPPVMRSDTAALMIGSLPFAAIAGVVEACKVQEILGQEKIEATLLDHSHYLRSELRKRELNPLGARTKKEESPIVTFAFSKADEFVEFLTSKNIHVNQRRGKVRVSPHFYNTKEDLDLFLEALDSFH